MSKELSFTFWDVQHGNATHIITPNGRVVVIDLGDGEGLYGSSGRFSPLIYLKYYQQVRQIDKLIITHPHRDHIDDIENVSALNPKILQRPKWLSEEDIRRGNRPVDESKISQYLEMSNRYTQPSTRPNNTGFADDWGGVQFRCYDSRDVPRSNLNNHSLVTFVEYAGLKALLPGDNESASWHSLLLNPKFCAELSTVDLLLASHHGRDNGFCIDLFEAGLRPRITVISDDQTTSTSVTGKYVAQTRGWDVYKPDGTKEERYCVTTRCDGTIRVRFGLQDSGRNFLNVRIEK